ncbi:MAG TPA: hypothetical protein VNV83_12720 [Acidimicrobiales bacterium]|jgi:hypothetical protein|nr:hypothetical protein [Acidimicrobiales bacterium]HXC78824.1 hypothetical protein [Candidatus Acidoferrum sp.]
MTKWPELERFLQTDPKDVGCDEAMAVLHVYADMMAVGEDPELVYPGVSAHLRACGPCVEDLHGLLEAIRATSEGD